MPPSPSSHLCCCAFPHQALNGAQDKSVKSIKIKWNHCWGRDDLPPRTCAPKPNTSTGCKLFELWEEVAAFWKQLWCCRSYTTKMFPESNVIEARQLKILYKAHNCSLYAFIATHLFIKSADFYPWGGKNVTVLKLRSFHLGIWHVFKNVPKVSSWTCFYPRVFTLN